jgi:RibD C-terminal domain
LRSRQPWPRHAAIQPQTTTDAIVTRTTISTSARSGEAERWWRGKSDGMFTFAATQPRQNSVRSSGRTRRSTFGLGLEGPEYLAWLDQSPERHYTALMGATTYRLMSELAATSDDPSFAQLTELSKVVLSSTLKNPLAWANTRLVDRDPVEAVRSMKEDGARPLRTIGSHTLCRSLLEAGRRAAVSTPELRQECAIRPQQDFRREPISTRPLSPRAI